MIPSNNHLSVNLPGSTQPGNLPEQEQDLTLAGTVCWAEIELDAIAENIRSFKKHVGPAVEVIAVVKANAYGHGAFQVAQTALQAGSSYLAVHRLNEGIQLRQANIQAPILIMGHTPLAGAEQIVRWQLTPTVTTLELAQALSACASSAGRSVPVHVKVDTGMNRYGLYPEEVLPFLQAVSQLPSLSIEGLFTHLATADWSDTSYARWQLETFDSLLVACRSAGHPLPLAHALNSAGVMHFPEAHYNAVRVGISMYGMQPSGEWPSVFPLRPALTLKSRVCRIRDLPGGSPISYSQSFITSRPTRVALVATGYGDGYPRSLSNHGSVLICGLRAPILGRICMDQLMVDVTHIPNISLDDEVVLIGQQGEEVISVEEVANLAGTINYEITTSLLSRVTRVYRRGGKISHIVSIDNPADI